VALNTQIGCRTVPMRYREVARVLEFGLIQTIRRVVLPAAAPSILAGLQLGLVSAWIGTVGAEYLIESGVGLGVSISGARELNDLATVIVGVLLLGLIGLLLDRIARVAASRLITGRTA
jgi:sulfonate transport system permease protein